MVTVLMRLIVPLLVIIVVVYGVVAGSPLWVIAGAAGAALLAGGRFGSFGPDDASQFNRLAKRAAGPPWRWLFYGAVLCALLSAWISQQDQFNFSSFYVWLLALVLLLAAGLVHDRARPRAAAVVSGEPAPGTSPGDPAASPAAVPGDEHAPLWTRVDWLLVVALTLLALALRLYQLGAFLPPMHGDEGEMGLLALLARYGPASGLSPQPLPPFSTAFLDHPTLFHYLQVLPLLLFGDTITALRTLSAVVGALCAPLIYLIGRLAWGRIAGFTAGWLLAVSHLHIHYSRIALNNIETVWFVILLIALLALLYEITRSQGLPGVEASPTLASDSPTEQTSPASPTHSLPTPPLTLLISIGLVTGLGQYFYFGSRLMPILAAILLFVLWRMRRVPFWQLGVAAAAAAVVYLPLAAFYAGHPTPFVGRMQGVTVFSPAGITQTLGPQAVWPNDLPLLLWAQVKTNLLFFLNGGDRSAFYLADIPGFDKVTVVLFWLGLGVVVAHARRFHELTLLLWLGFGVLLAGVVTLDAPNGPRLIVAVPAMYLVCGVFMQKAVDLAARLWPQYGRRTGLGAVGAVAAATLLLNYNIYFVEYQQRQPNTGVVSLAEDIAAAGPDYRAYLLGAPNLFVNYGTIRFLAFATEKYDLETPDRLAPLVSQAGSSKGALVLALPNHLADLQQIQQQFPNGTLSEHKDVQGAILYATYRIPAAELARGVAPKP
jgi:4-amino-4-deoxy-L-arabinose transferase-like glycosyltransferase